jgi:hypothetical protein
MGLFESLGKAIQHFCSFLENASKAAEYWGGYAKARAIQKRLVPVMERLEALDAIGRGAELLEKHHKGETFCEFCGSWHPISQARCSFCGAHEG